MKWKDTSSYGRGERGSGKEPWSWTLASSGDVRIVVHRHAKLPGWLLTVTWWGNIVVDCISMGDDLEKAKRDAVTHVRGIFETVTNALQALDGAE